MTNKRKTLKPLLIAIGAGAALSLSAGPLAAASNTFQVDKLSSGYNLADSHMDKTTDGKCSADKKTTDGKCSADKKGDKSKDGKCGAGKCGADKKSS